MTHLNISLLVRELCYQVHDALGVGVLQLSAADLPVLDRLGTVGDRLVHMAEECGTLRSES